MWSILERLPGEVMGHKVLSMLGCKDLVRLDSAVANKIRRPILQVWYAHGTASNWNWQSSQLTASILQWCVKRGLGVHVNKLTISRDFQEVILLLATNPKLFCDELCLATHDQAELYDVEATLAQLQKSDTFAFDFHPGGESLTFHNPGSFACRLRGLSWNAQYITMEDTRTLIQGSPMMETVTIFNPTTQVLQIAASLGSSLRSIWLEDDEFTDAMLTTLAQGCSGLRELNIYGSSAPDASFDAGLISVAERNKGLQEVSIDGVRVTDAAITGVCTHCQHLRILDIGKGHLTSAALTALARAVPPLQKLSLGWKVQTTDVFDAPSALFSTLQEFELPSIDPACTATLERAMACMPALTKLLTSAEADSGANSSLPAQALANLTANSPHLQHLYIHIPVTGCSESLLMNIFTHCPLLETAMFICEGVNFTDRVLTVMAERCPRLSVIEIKAPSSASDVGLIALARGLPKLRTLTLFAGPTVTDDALHAFAEHSSELILLGLYGRLRTSEAAQLHLARACPKLFYLMLPGVPLSAKVAEEVRALLQARKTAWF